MASGALRPRIDHLPPRRANARCSFRVDAHKRPSQGGCRICRQPPCEGKICRSTRSQRPDVCLVPSNTSEGSAWSTRPSRTRYRLNPPRLYKKERLSAIRHRLERQPAARPQAIAHRHSRSSPGEHNWDFTRLVGIDHQDHADDRAVPVCVYLADIPHQDDVVMMPWSSHPASSPRPSRQPFWGAPSADSMIFYPNLACQSALRLIETMNENILAVHRQYQ